VFIQPERLMAKRPRRFRNAIPQQDRAVEDGNRRGRFRDHPTRDVHRSFSGLRHRIFLTGLFGELRHVIHSGVEK
jgi:hypothetical protein